MTDIVIMEEDDIVVLEFNNDYYNENLVYHEKMRRKLKNKKISKKIKEIIKENEKLKNYNTILLNICGVRQDEYISKSASFIQAHVRGWILRCDKKVFDKSVDIFSRLSRVFLAKKKVEKRIKSIVKIQSFIRGTLQRITPLGKGIKCILELKKEVLEHEIKLLLLSRFRQ